MAAATAIFAGCKWLTWRRTPVPGAPWWKHIGYLLAWPGLDARSFLSRGPLPAEELPRIPEWTSAILKMMAGVALFWGVARLIPGERQMLYGWVGMIGLILMLHFGAFHLLSCAWRSIGVDAKPLMRAPLKSVSVSEFWGRRWNTAFRDFTHRFFFRPLNSRLGLVWALVVGFVFSGIIHDLVISVPARGGYGWPTVYFSTQAAAMLAERSGAGRMLGLGRSWRGRSFTMLVLIVPAYGLFHPPFVMNVIVPFMQAVGAR
ncbi:MAG: MBOAT family protein [Pyrinomonadaceae bacterium]